MSSNATRRLEAWLVLAAMLAALAWYAKPQLGYTLVGFQYVADAFRAVLGG